MAGTRDGLNDLQWYVGTNGELLPLPVVASAGDEISKLASELIPFLSDLWEIDIRTAAVNNGDVASSAEIADKIAEYTHDFLTAIGSHGGDSFANTCHDEKGHFCSGTSGDSGKSSKSSSTKKKATPAAVEAEKGHLAKFVGAVHDKLLTAEGALKDTAVYHKLIALKSAIENSKHGAGIMQGVHVAAEAVDFTGRNGAVFLSAAVIGLSVFAPGAAVAIGSAKTGIALMSKYRTYKRLGKAIPGTVKTYKEVGSRVKDIVQEHLGGG